MVPATQQPTETPTSLQTLVIPASPVNPAQTQTSQTHGAIAGPAAGGGFSRLVDPTQPTGTQVQEPTPEILQPTEVVTGSQPGQQGFIEPDYLKSSNPPMVSNEKDMQGSEAVTASDMQSGESSDVLDTLRGTAHNASAMTPASKIVPPMAVPAVAVTAGMAIALVGNMVWANTDKIFTSKIFDFFRDFMGENMLQRLDEYEARKRDISVRMANKTILGLTHAEIAVAIAGAFLIGIATLFALREEFGLNTIALYVVTGGVAVTVHEMGHRYAAHHQDVATEVKFWELGTVIMFFTGWFAGNVFAQPHRTVMEETDSGDHPVEAKISLAGPVVSLCLALITVPFLFVGGEITRIASVLLMLTMLIAVYHLMPFEPMDGKTIYHWNRKLLLVILIPLLAVYYFLFLL
jgi:hypothetical protein